MKKLVWLICVIVVSVPVVITAQEKKSAAVDPATVVSGAELYKIHCAACHGPDGKGGGPAAGALKRIPPDLTTISRRSGGQFPTMRVTHIIDGQELTEAHGTREMPIWGDLLPQHRDEALLKLREHNLAEYIRSLQK